MTRSRYPARVPVLTVSQAARALAVAGELVVSLCETGHLEALELSRGRWLIREDSINEIRARRIAAHGRGEDRRHSSPAAP